MNDNLTLTTTGLKPRNSEPSFAGNGLSDEFSEQEKRIRDARRIAARDVLFRLKPEDMDDDSVKAYYRGITGDLFPEVGPDDDGTRVFGKRKSADMRKNLSNLQEVMRGNFGILKDADLERFDKLPREQQVAEAAEEESNWNKLTSWAKGERGIGIFGYLKAAMVSPMGENRLHEAIVANLPENMSPEERQRMEDDIIGDYRKRHAKNQPLWDILSMRGPGGLSDRGQWILSKSLMDGHIDMPGMMALDEKEQNKVMAGFALARGDLKTGSFFGIDMDISTGTTGDRVQMGLHGLWDSILNLAVDTYKFGNDIRMWAYGKCLRDESERDAFFKAWSLNERALAAEKQALPEGGFWGESYQTLMENLHWIIPYKGVDMAKKAQKAVLGTMKGLKEQKLITKAGEAVNQFERLNVDKAAKFIDEVDRAAFIDSTMNQLASTSAWYREQLKTIRRMRAWGHVKDAGLEAGIVAGHAMTYSTFAREFIESCDLAGMSREESVLMSAFVAAVNDRIERLAIPGLEHTLSVNAAESMSFEALKVALKEGNVGKWLGDYIGNMVKAGASVSFTEGAIEEPLQQLGIEYGKALAPKLNELVEKGEITLPQKDQILDILAGGIEKSLKTYINTTVDMLPAMAGYLGTSGPRQKTQQVIAQIVDNHFTHASGGYKSLGIANLMGLQAFAESEVRKAILGKDDGKTKTTEEINLETREAIQRGQEIFSQGGEDVTGRIMRSLGVSQNTAEMLFDLYTEREVAQRYSPRARAAVAGASLADLTEETISKLPGYVKGSYKGNTQDGVASCRIKVGNDANNDWLKNGEMTVYFQKVSNLFQNADGTLNEAAIAVQCKDDSSFRVSFESRQKSEYGEVKVSWTALPMHERRRFVLENSKAYTLNADEDKSGGIIRFVDEKTGAEAELKADILIRLSTGHLADIAHEYSGETGMPATGWDLRHEVWHAVWRATQMMVGDEELHRIADGFKLENDHRRKDGTPVDRYQHDKDGNIVKDKNGRPVWAPWMLELDEKIAPEIERYASGKLFKNELSGRFARFQTWLGGLLDKAGIGQNQVLDKYGKPYGLASFYEAVTQGKIGSGEWTIPRITTSEAKKEGTGNREQGTGEVKAGEIPVEVTDEEREEEERKQSEEAAEPEETPAEKVEEKETPPVAPDKGVAGPTVALPKDTDADGNLVPESMAFGRADLEKKVAAKGGDFAALEKAIADAADEKAVVQILGEYDPTRSGIAWALGEWSKAHGETVPVQRLEGDWNYGRYIFKDLPDGGYVILKLRGAGLQEVHSSMEAEYSTKEGQFRATGTTSSNQTVEKIAANPKFNEAGRPDAKLKNGTMILVNGRGDAWGGNHRLQGVKRGYEKGTAARYRREVIEMCERLGIALTAEQLEAPLLVGELVGIVNSKISFDKLARLTNDDDMQKGTTSEQVAEAGRKLKEKGLLRKVKVRRDGSIDVSDAPTRDALRSFFDEIGMPDWIIEKEANGETFYVLDDNAKDILGKAVLAYLLETEDRNDALINELVDRAEDLDMANEVNAIVSMAVPLLLMAERAKIHDIRPMLRTALTKYVEWRNADTAARLKAGKDLKDWVNRREFRWAEFNGQDDMFAVRDPIVDRIGDMLAEARKGRKFVGGEETAADRERTVKAIRDFLGTIVETAANVNVETEDLEAGRAPSDLKAIFAEKFGTRFSVSLEDKARQYFPEGTRFSVGTVQPATKKEYAGIITKLGETKDVAEAQWIFPSGKMPKPIMKSNGRFSYRSHDGIFFLLERKTRKGLDKDGVDLTGYADMMAGGAMRLDIDNAGIEMTRKPSDEIFDMIYDICDAAYQTMEADDLDTFRVDISDDNATTLFTLSYPRKTSARRIINDIKNFYDNDYIPENAVGPEVERRRAAGTLNYGDYRWSVSKPVVYVTPTKYKDATGANRYRLNAKEPISVLEAHISPSAIRRKYADEIDAFRAHERGMFLGKSGDLTRTTSEEGIQIEFMDPDLSRDIGSEAFDAVRGEDVGGRVRDVSGRSWSEYIGTGQDQPTLKMSEGQLRNVLADANDPLHREALYFAAIGKVGDDIESAAQRLVGECADDVSRLAEAVKAASADSVVALGSDGALDDVLAEAVATAAGIPVGRGKRTAIVGFSGLANGTAVEAIKNIVADGGAPSGVWVLCHRNRGSALDFIAEDVAIDADGIRLVGDKGTMHNALRRIVRVANPYWGLGEVSKYREANAEEFEIALNLLVRVPRYALSRMSGEELVRLMGRYAGLENAVDALRKERARTTAEDPFKARPFPVSELGIVGGRVFAGSTTTDLYGGEKRAFMTPDGLQELTDWEFVTRYGDEELSDPEAMEAAKRILRMRLNTVLLAIHRHYTPTETVDFVMVDDGIAGRNGLRTFALDKLYNGLKLMGHTGNIVEHSAYVRYPDRSVSFDKHDPIAYRVTIFDLAMESGNTIADVAEALKKEHGGRTSNAVLATALAANGDGVIVPTEAQLQSIPGFGKLSANQRNAIYGYDYRKRVFNNLSNTGKSGSVSEAQGRGSGVRPGNGGLGSEAGSRGQVRSSFSVGEINGTPHYIAALSGKQRQGDAVYPDAGMEIATLSFSVGARKRAEYRDAFARRRPDIAPEDVEAYLDEIAKYETPKKQKLAVHWLIAGTIELPEDSFKLDKAITTSERAKVDPFQYRNPEDIFTTFPQHLPKDPAIDPDTVPELTDKEDRGHGVTVYTLSEKIVKDKRRAGQIAMRKIINTHWGKDASPWCLLQGDENGELTEDSRGYWEHYSALPKKVAFLNGRLLAFMATDAGGDGWQRFENMKIEELWWDRKDVSHDGIPIEGKIPGDTLGRSGVRELEDGELVLVGRTWRGNKRNGTYEEWIGSVKTLQEEYTDGKLDGTKTVWRSDGTLERVAGYKDGKPVGWLRTYGEWGNVISVEHFNEKSNHDRPQVEFTPDGGLRRFVEYAEGDKPIRIAAFYSDGELMSYNESRDDVLADRAYWRDNGQNISWKDASGDYHSVRKLSDGRFWSVVESKAGSYSTTTIADDGDSYAALPADLRAKLESESAAVLDEMRKKAQRIHDAYTGIAERIASGEISDDDELPQPSFSVANRKHEWSEYAGLHDRVLHSTSHIHMVGHDNPITDAQYERFKLLKRYAPDRALAMAEELAGSIWAKQRYLGKYLLGKHFGRDNEALEAVRHYYQPKNMEQLRQIIGTERPVKWVYVHNTDGQNTNKMPYALAKDLADRFGGEVDNSIWKKSDERNTGASMQDRASRNFEWYGKLDLAAKPMVFIVDDVWTTGSTTVSMLEYLHDQGVDVRGIVTLATASNTDHILPQPADWSKLLKKSRIQTVEEASHVAGLDLRKLTGSEIYAYGVKGAAGRGGLAAWFERSFGLFEIPGGLFQDPGAHGRDTEEPTGIETAVGPLSRKPRQQTLSFSSAFPRLNRMSADDLIVTRIASEALIKPQRATGTSRSETPYGFMKAHRTETEEYVRRAHPEFADDYGKVTERAAMLIMRAQMLARDFRKSVQGGVTEQEILKRLPKKMEPYYRREQSLQRHAGGWFQERADKAKQILDDSYLNGVRRAVAAQSGVDSDLFEAWAGVDFSETLAKVLGNPNAKEERGAQKDPPIVLEPDETGTAGTSGEGGVGGGVKSVKELENPRKFAEYLVDLAWKYWREKNGIAANISPWSSAVSLQFMRRTAENIYRQLVKDIVYSGSRETATKYIDKFATIPTMQGLLSAMTFVGGIINDRRIRETKQAMCEELDTFLKQKLGAQGRFKPDKEELRRKVTAELELRARYMRHTMWLTKEAAADEALELHRRLDRLAAQYDEAGHDIDQSKEAREIQRNLNILREFGALRYRPLGEIETAKKYWEEAANGSGEEILRAMNDREIRTQKASAILAAAVTNPKRGEAVESGVGSRLNDYIVGHMGFVSLLQDMVRFSKGNDRAAADAVIHYIALEIQKAGDRARTEQREESDAFYEAVERIYGADFNSVMAGMTRRDERFAPFMGSRGGKKVVPTKARAMQLMVSLLQGRKPGDSYYENVIKFDRQRQAAQIAALLDAKDLAIVRWLGNWYERNRQGLSEVCEALFGIGVYSESPNYFPVRMLMERQGLESAEGVGWSIFPRALTPRVRNERDFDTSVDIFAMWMARMQEGAQWKAHAKLGLEMRGIFGRSELQEAITANHGTKANQLMLEFITDILSGQAPVERTTSGVERISDALRGWTALTALGGNVGVMFKQTTSIPAFGFEIGLRNTAKYVLSAFTSPGFEAMSRIWNSEQRKTRWDLGSSEAIANALRKKDAGRIKRLLQKAMITNKLGDVVPGLVVGQGIYRDCIERGMSEEDAMAETWMLIERTQQSSRMENQTKLQRRIKLGRMLYQFLSTQQQYLQYEMRSIRELWANPNGENARKAIRTVLLNHFILTSLYFWMGELYKMALGQEPPEDQFKDWMISNLLGPFGSLYVAGFMCKATLDRYIKGRSYGKSAEMIPLASFIKGLANDSADVMEAIFSNDKSWDDVLEEGMQMLERNNSTVRDLRKIDKYRIRPEAYEKKKSRKAK